MATDTFGDQCLPIMLMAYNRPKAIFEQFKRLEKVAAREIHLFIDGAKSIDTQAQRKVVSIASKWAESTRHLSFIHIATKNLGIREHFPFAAKVFFNIHSKGIILEDDISFSSDFFPYCERHMSKNVLSETWSISGNSALEKRIRFLDHKNASFYTNIHTVHGFATTSNSVERFLRYRTFSHNKVMAEIEAFSRELTNDPMLRRSIELAWKRKYLRSLGETGGGSWDNTWELAGWNSKLPSLMPCFSLTKEVTTSGEIGTHHSIRRYDTSESFNKSKLSDQIYQLNQGRDIKMMNIWGITRRYSWAYSLRISSQLRLLTSK